LVLANRSREMWRACKDSKLTSFRLKDKVHLLDLLEVGLIDESWCNRLPKALAERLREVLQERDRN
jgi:hypothetical protein